MDLLLVDPFLEQSQRVDHVPTQRKTRVGTPRVRTGCVTCKTRHVKCDETKPACMKCLTSCGTCGGYQIKPRKNQSWRHRQSPATKPVTQRNKLPIEPTIQDGFDDELQRLYFDEWRYLAQAPLSGYTPSKLWSTFMPQLTYQNNALRHAALAIGAMSRAMSVECTGDDAFRSQHHHNAVAHYCSALRLLGQGNVSSTKMRDAMLASILFASFEGLRSNQKSALQHISFGITLLRGLFACPDALVDQMAPDPGDLIIEVVFLYTQLTIQTQTVMKGYFKPNQPPVTSLKKSLEEDNTQDILNIRLCYYLKPRTNINIMPSVFSTTEQAWEYWAVTERHIERYGPPLVAVINSIFAEDATNLTSMEYVLQRFQTHPQLQAFSRMAHQHLQKWHASFDPLYQQGLINAHVDRETYHALIHMRIQYLCLCMYTLFSQHGSYEVVSSLTNACREINELCELLLRAQNQAARGPASIFTMNTGLTWILLFVALNCRDSIVRENARRILDTYPRREGLWDSRSFSAIAKRNREIESENTRDGTMTEQWHRLCRRVFLFEDAGARIVFRFMCKDSATGHWELVEEIAEWDDIKQSTSLEWKRRSLTGRCLILQWGRPSHAMSETLFPGMTCSGPRLELLSFKPCTLN